MKRKILIILIVLSIGLCLSVLTGCSLFSRPDKNDVDPPDPPSPPDPPVKTELQAPESIRLDAATDTLYIADCSASGVKYYNVTQKAAGNTYNLGSLDASDLKAENGYFAMKNVTLGSHVICSFQLIIFCTAEKNDRVGASSSFDFECVGGIEDDYNSGNCRFDNDTGVYSWPAVEGAIGYKINIFDKNEVTVVDEPRFTVEESINTFSVTPLFAGNKVGLSCRVSLECWILYSVKGYDAEKRAFVLWNDDGNYIAEITENGQTVTKPVNGKELPYVPTSNSVSIRLITLSPSKRPGVGPLKTFDVLPDNLDIKLHPQTCELSWNEIEGAKEYKVKLQLQDGTDTAQTFTTETPSILLKDLYVDDKKFNVYGAVSATVTPIFDTQTIALFSPFDFYAIESLKSLIPDITRDAETGKINVSIPSDEAVESYRIYVVEKNVQPQVVEVERTVGALTTDVQIDLPINKLREITIARDRYKGGKGHYCFIGNFWIGEYSRWMLYTEAPEVVMREVNNTYGEEGFTIDVKFPEQLIGMGGFELKYNYASESVGDISFKDDTSLSIGASVGKNALKVEYQSFMVDNYEYAILFSDSFQTDISCLGVDLTANKEQIEWQSVEGAESYCVEMSDGGAYTTVYEGSDPRYVYSLNNAGDYTFRVTPRCADPFVIEVGKECNVRKLAAPTVTMNNGELSLVMPDEPKARIVTVLDGETKELTKDNIRTALLNKTRVSLVARCTRSDTSTCVYVDSDDAHCTLHRIAEVNDDSMGLQVDNANCSASWTAADNADNYYCRLYKKSAEGEFDEISAFSGNQTQIDCNDLTCGEYKLEIKPLNYSNGTDMYLYFDGSASGTFTKEGIRSAGLGNGGLTFTVDSFLTSATAANATVKLGYRHSTGTWTGNFPISDSIDISGETAFFDNFSGVKAITFSIGYDGIDDGELNRANTLKGKEYVLPVSIKTCETPDFIGSYSFVNTDNYTLNTAKVTLTPVYRELKDFESYSIVYKQKYKVSVDGSYVDKVTEISETAGTELVFQVPNAKDFTTRLFGLRVTAQKKFTAENGEVVFYRSSGVKSNDELYKVSVFHTLEQSSIFGENTAVTEKGATQVNFTLRVSRLENFDEYFDYGFLRDDGTWSESKEKIRNTEYNYYYDTNFGLIDDDILSIYAGKEIRMRVRRSAKSIDGVNYDASCWYYLRITVPPLTE